MYISKINSLNSFKNLHFKAEQEPTDSNVVVETPQVSKNSDSQSDMCEAFKKEFAGYSDEQLMTLASEKPSNDYRKTGKQLAKTLLVVFPLVDIITNGLLTKGNLSGKLKASANQTGRWGLILGTVLGITALKSSINEKSPELDNINKNHPVLTFGIDFGAMLGTFTGVHLLKDAAKKYAQKNHADVVEKLKTTFVNPMKTALNSSKINTKLIIPAEKSLYKKANGIGRAGSIVLSLLAPTIAVSAMLKGYAVVKQKREEAENNFNLLKLTQVAIQDDLSDNE